MGEYCERFPSGQTNLCGSSKVLYSNIKSWHNSQVSGEREKVPETSARKSRPITMSSVASGIIIIKIGVGII